MILYRPHRGGLLESMQELKEFTTFEDLLDYLYSYISTTFNKTIYKSDFVFSYYCYDTRIKWHTYTVAVYGLDSKEKKSFPHIVGFMTFKY